MNLFKIILCNCFLLLSIFCFAQNTTVDTSQLKPVEIQSSRINNFSSGNKIQVIDSTTLSRYSTSNLADLLANESQVFIKSYGLGSLASTSFRGAGSSHTAVLWNGFNLQSSTHGMLDVALVPVQFLNDVKLQYGSSGASWGSGAVGGTIHLNNAAIFNKGISINAGTNFGSFSDLQQHAGFELSKKRLTSSFKWFNHEAKNNFLFENSAQYGKPQQKQINAELEQYGFLQENYLQVNQHQQLNTRVWYQFNDRNIPPSMTQNTNVSSQKDEFWRLSAEWQRTGERLTLLARAAYFDENLTYLDPMISENALTHSRTTITEIENRFSVTNYDVLNIGINNTYNEAIAKNYNLLAHQNRTALFLNYKIHNSKNTWNAVLSARQEMIQTEMIPFVSSLGIEGKLLRYFIIKANAGQHYRVPTFNDLYFQGAGGKGNPDLQPENGWNEEVGLTHKHRYSNFEWELGATAFNRDIDNWIVWSPVSSTIWSPKNIAKVWSRGIEYNLGLTHMSNKLQVRLSGLYNYVLSTYEKITATTDASLGKQLIYVPIQNAQGGFLVSYKKFSVSYNQSYTGYRYTTTDNIEYLKPYTLGNVSVCCVFTCSKYNIKLFSQLNNIWNEIYQVMAYRAMPMMNYQFGLTLYFNEPNTN